MLSKILCGNFYTSSLLKDFQAALFHLSQLEIIKLFTPPCLNFKSQQAKGIDLKLFSQLSVQKVFHFSNFQPSQKTSQSELMYMNAYLFVWFQRTAENDYSLKMFLDGEK